MERVAIAQPQKQKTNGFHPEPLPSDELWRMSVKQYHAMIRAGVLTEDDPVELLEGWLVRKMPKNPRHSAAVHAMRRLLERLLGDRYYIEPQDAITLRDSEPEPDVVVARGNAELFQTRHPGPNDLVLVVEVSDSTLRRDRSTKKRVYAHAGIPLYWIVNLIENQIEIYSEPQPRAKEPDYRLRMDYGLLAAIPVVIEGEVVGTFNIRDIIPKPVET